MFILRLLQIYIIVIFAPLMHACQEFIGLQELILAVKNSPQDRNLLLLCILQPGASLASGPSKERLHHPAFLAQMAVAGL
jgi:hypothetical protein